jgi:CheY-like chemotaxis protein/two-component sensor histidine kinase
MRGVFQEMEGMLPGDKRDEMGELMRSVAVGADRITQIVRNVKLLSRGNDGDTELVDVHVAVDTAVEMLKPGLSPQIELIIERELDSRMRVRGRRLGLEQVLLNLLKNSTHALAEVAAGQAVIRVRAQALEGRRARITVSDNGRGIPEDVLDKIFEPFFTTKPVNQGTGLGLSICHGLVSGMNGTIEVKSEPGRGTTFTITLPLAPADLPASVSSQETKGAPERGGDIGARGRVLILDDERFVLKVLTHMLRGHDVATASSVDEALAICGQGTFDLILSDIMMPGASGCDFHHRLARIRPGEEQKIVFITGGTMMDEVRTFLDSVSNTCLEKPIDARALRALTAERVGARAGGTGQP